MEPAENAQAAGSASPTTRRVSQPLKTESRRRHLWSRKSKSEAEKDSPVARRHQDTASHHRDNFAYAQEFSFNTGTGSALTMPLRVRNAAVQCILLVDSAQDESIAATGSVTSLKKTTESGNDGERREATVATKANSGSGDSERNVYHGAGQHQRRKAIVLVNSDEETLLTKGSAHNVREPSVTERSNGDGGAPSGGSGWLQLSPNDLGMRSDTLVSPRVSPVMSHRRVPSLVVTSSVDKSGQSCLMTSSSERQWLSVPSCSRRKSSYTLHSASDDSDTEQQSPPVLRRGRRPAIFDSKSLVLEDGPEEGDSCDESDTSSLLTGRRKLSSVRLGINYPGDLHSQKIRLHRPGRHTPFLKRNTIAEFANTKVYQDSTATLMTASAEQDKKTKNAGFYIMKLIDRKANRSKDSITDLTDVLQNLKPTAFKDTQLDTYKKADLCEILSRRVASETGADEGKPGVTSPSLSLHRRPLKVRETERKRREAVWELFQSECIFLIDHLMALKHCFMEPLKKVQVEGFLMFAEPQDLFGNLDELCYYLVNKCHYKRIPWLLACIAVLVKETHLQIVSITQRMATLSIPALQVSHTFCCDFIASLLKDDSSREFGPTEVIVQGLKRFSQLTRDGEVYHEYCLNYSKAMTYLEQLRKNEEFVEFEKFCEQDPRCHRLLLTDLLISPMQHCTKVPLLLSNIRRYTDNLVEQQMLNESLEKLEKSINELETKMLWLKNFERVQEIQQQIQWQPVTELEPRAFIPDFLRNTLSRQPCERILASPKRQLLYEGPVTMIEISKTVDMYMFLFDDILLLTRVKKSPRKKSNTVDAAGQYSPENVHTDGAVFVVHRQPIALDRFTVHDVRPTATTGDWWQFFTCASGQMTPSVSHFSTVAATSGGTASNSQGTASMLPMSHHHGSPSLTDTVGGSIDVTALGNQANVFLRCLPAAAAPSAPGGSGMKNAFVIVQITRFQQVIGVFTLQAPTEALKVAWLSRLQETQAKYKEAVKVSQCVVASAPAANTAANSPRERSGMETIDNGPTPSETNNGGQTNVCVNGARNTFIKPPDRPGRLTSHRVLGTMTSLSSAFWSSTSSERRSTASSMQSIEVTASRGSLSNCGPMTTAPQHPLAPAQPPPTTTTFVKMTLSRTSSAGPSTRSTMSDIAEETVSFQQADCDDRSRSKSDPVSSVEAAFSVCPGTDGDDETLNVVCFPSSSRRRNTSSTRSSSCPCLRADRQCNHASSASNSRGWSRAASDTRNRK